jgi:Ca-activated chloride channel family protein
MTDDLDKLRAAMASATPAARRKAADIAMAMEAFDRSQGSASDARPTSGNHPTGWFWQGVRTMMNAMTTRGGIVATTALVAIGVVMVLPDRAAIGTLGTLSIDEAPVVRSEPAPELEGLSSADVAAVKAPPVAAIPAPEMAAPQAEARQQFRGATALSDVRERPAITRPGDIARPPEAGTEAFANMPPSALKTTIEDPVATFSVDVDTASYAVIRSSLTRGTMPPRDAVRIEEMVNYFPYAYPVPDGFHPFEPTVTVMPSPWNDGTRLVHIAVQGETAAIENRPPLNLVFLIDTSGSMQEAARLPLLKQSFAMMLSELRADDRVAIVTYAGSAGQVLEPTRASERGTILAALDQLEAGGSTAGQAGLQQAYSVAEAMADDGDVTRVILATDGDFNVGLSAIPEALKDFIADQRDSGTYLSVLGFGRGNLDDATMQALAQNGNGTAAYIDTLSEAQQGVGRSAHRCAFPNRR